MTAGYNAIKRSFAAIANYNFVAGLGRGMIWFMRENVPTLQQKPMAAEENLHQNKRFYSHPNLLKCGFDFAIVNNYLYENGMC